MLSQSSFHRTLSKNTRSTSWVHLRSVLERYLDIRTARHGFHSNLSYFQTLHDKKPVILEEYRGRRRSYYSESPNVVGGKGANSLSWEWDSQSWRTPLIAPLLSLLRATFLPISYPQSVHQCYLKFHIWQATETYVGAFVSVLCSQAMLESLGVAASAATTTGAVAVQWMLKDSIAEVGKLAFIRQFARSFDSHPKSWKAIGELLTTVGSGIQLCTLIGPPSSFLFLAASGNIAKSISWAVWGATHTCFIRRFALINNVGDLTAKSDAQGALAQIAGWFSGILAISYSYSPQFLFTTFAALAPLHCFATYNLLKWANFHVLNQSRMSLIIQHYIFTGSVPYPHELKPFERYFGESIRPHVKMPDINLGVTVMEAFGDYNELQVATSVFENELYLINLQQGVLSVVLHKDANTSVVLKALFNAIQFEKVVKRSGLLGYSLADVRMRPLLELSHNWVKDNYAPFVAKLESCGWFLDSVVFNDEGTRAEWKSQS